jgi:hypothetical protein
MRIWPRERVSNPEIGRTLAAGRHGIVSQINEILWASLSGNLKFFTVVCDSGRIKTCAFCETCGTPIYHRTGSNISIKAGTLDDTSLLRPTHHYWTKRKQPWVIIPDDATCIADDG